MQAALVDRPPLDVTCLRHVGPYGAPVAAFWQQVVFPWLVANGRLGLQPIYGVSYDNPLTTEPAQCRYDVAIECPVPLPAPGAAQSMRLAGGPYAVTAFNGTVADMPGAWAALRDVWLPAHGRRLDGRPFIEIYPAITDYDPRTGRFSCQLAMPAAPA